jgi:biotin carboxylase
MTSVIGNEGALVLLGGADGAFPTIQAAHRLGLSVICVDMRAEAPAARVSDEFLHLSTADVPAIVTALADRDDIRGVISPASDVNIPHQRAIAAALGLPCAVTLGAVSVSTDKAYFHDLCATLDIETPRSVSGTAEAVLGRVDDLRWPLVVKPVDLGGGRGIVRCTARDELVDAVLAASDWSPSGRVIVEEFVAGRDCGAEAFVIDGEVVMTGVSERILGAPPGLVTVGHSMRPDDPAIEPLADRVATICEALGYRTGPVNLDLIEKPSGEIVIIEMGTRLGGNGIGELLGMMHGVDSTELAVRAVVDGEVPRPDILSTEDRRFVAARSFFADRPGILRSLHGTDDMAQVPGVVDVLVTAVPGDPVDTATQCRSKAGFVLLAADSAEELAESVDLAMAPLRFELEPAHEPADRALSAT